MPAISMALRSLFSLMQDTMDLNQLLLQWLSASPTARNLDQEAGDLGVDILGGGPP